MSRYCDMKEFTQDCLGHLLHRIFDAAQLDLTCEIETHPGAVPDLVAAISGPDTPVLTARNAEVLRAIEHLAFEIRRLEPNQHDLLSIDAGNYRQQRNEALRAQARRAVARVLETGRPFLFEPMSSHERRFLHLALTPSGLRTSSTGEGPHRAVVLYPERAGKETTH